MEQRKLDYILKKADLTMEDVDERFTRIDKAMDLIESGQIKMVYEPDPFCDYYPKEIVEIVDRQNGIVKTYERSINKYEEWCILDYELKKEDYALIYGDKK